MSVIVLTVTQSIKVSDIEKYQLVPAEAWSFGQITIQEWCNCATCKLALTLLAATTLSNTILEINKWFFYDNIIWINKWCKKYSVLIKLLIELWRLCCIPSKKPLIRDFKWPPMDFFGQISRIKRSQVMFKAKFGPTVPNFRYD